MSAHKKFDLEVQLRRKYMRMKAINDHEHSILNHKLDHLNKTTVGKLEQHRKQSKEVTSLWKNMTNTTGWCKDAIKPRKKDFEASLLAFRSQVNPWAYCTQGSIEGWAKYPSSYKTREQRRPKTAHSVSPQDQINEGENDEYMEKPKSSLRPRPATVSGDRRHNKENFSEIEENLGIAGLQSKKMRVVKPMPFHSPRLNDKHVKIAKKWRPTTAGAKLSGSSNGDDSTDKVKRRLSSAVYGRYNSEATDNVFEDETDGIEEVDKAEKLSINIVIPQANMGSNEVGLTQPTPIIHPKSVLFQRTSSTFSQSSAKSEKSKTRTTSRKTYWSDSSSDEEFDHRGVIKDKENKQGAKESTIPKFYVKPQDRYKVEDMFLMRRYALLQRQIASEMPSSTFQDNDKLKIQPTFSAAAKRNLMSQLVEENNIKIKNSKKPNGQKGLHDRIQKFLRNIDEFIEEQNDEE